MKKLSPIALAIALAFPMVANAAASNADLQKEIEMLKAQLAELKQMVVKQAAAPVAPAVSSGDAALRAEVAAMRVKMDAMEDAHEANGFAGIKLSGFIDPTYIYNKRAGRGDFIFLNGSDGSTNDLSTDAWGYANANFGGVTLKIEKTFENDMQAVMKFRPYKSANTTTIEEAFVSIPMFDGAKGIAGKRNSFNGYESVDSSDGKLVTHNLLYDFGGPLQMTGIGVDFSAFGMDWKTMAGNMNSDRDLTDKANHNRGFHWRGDMEMSEFWGWGISGMHGTLGGENYHYVDADMWYTRGDLNVNAQVEMGKLSKGAFNGGDGKHFGTSLLASYNLGDGWELVGRADWLKDRKNGGYRSSGECDLGNLATQWIDFNGNGIVEPLLGEMSGVDLNGDGVPDTVSNDACGDYRNGFGPGMVFDSVLGVWVLGDQNKGATRSSLTLGLNYTINEWAKLKFEVRYDRSDLNSFFDWSSGSFKKSNTTIGAQTVVKF